MFDILSFFTEDTTTYSESNIVMYVFDETRTDEFIMNSLDSYRYAYISDEDLSENVEKMGTARSEEIKEVLPTDPIIQSGEFAEILTFMLFYALYPEYNVAPLRWRWKEEKNRAVHFADIMLLSCPDEEHPKDTDKIMTVEVKSRATRPDNGESSINNAIVGALKDSISREGKTLSFLLQRYKRDKQFGMAKKVKRFEDAVAYPYQTQHNAMAIVDSSYMDAYHIGNLDSTLIKEIESFNNTHAMSHRSMAVFVIPLDNLKSKYERVYQAIPNS